MFQHLAGATQGLAPSIISTRHIANQGMFDVVVIIEPVVQNGGGGYSAPIYGQKPTHYRVTVKIFFNGKTYTDSKILTPNEARVFAKLRGITLFSPDDVNDIMVSVNNIQIINKDEIKVKVELL